jgi:hypothetical protein
MTDKSQTREELDAAAREAGIAEPENLPNKAAVLEAIEALSSTDEPAEEPTEDEPTDEQPEAEVVSSEEILEGQPEAEETSKLEFPEVDEDENAHMVPDPEIWDEEGRERLTADGTLKRLPAEWGE